MAGDPLRHHSHYRSPERGSFMERVSEAVASGMGTVEFVVVSSLLILAWVLVNHGAHFLRSAVHGLGTGAGFDPAPFILLNLCFSAVAFYTGALVIIAQKAQSRLDQANALAAATHREELDDANKQLLERNTELTEEVARLTHEVHEHIVKAARPKRAPSSRSKQPGRRPSSKNS